MQGVPALLASLHHLSAFDNPGDWSRAQVEDREQAARDQQERERQEQVRLDQEAESHRRRAQQAEKNRVTQEEADRRRAQQAAINRAKEAEVERLFRAQQVQADRAKRGPAAGPAAAGPAAAGPSGAAATASTGPPPVLRYNSRECITLPSAEIQRMIARCDKEVQEVQDQKRQLDPTVAVLADRLRILTVRYRSLKEALATKRREEALKR
jgi:hypothetical protein